MPTLHDELYQSTAAPLLNEQYGEAALLQAGGVGGWVGVTVRVNRSGLETNVDPEGVTRRAELIVTINRADLPVLTLGSDKIQLPKRRGQDPQTLHLEELINDAGDEWVVACN